MERTTHDDKRSTSLTADEVWGYARKSTAGEGSSKSLDDQHEVNVETAAEYKLPLKLTNLLSEKAGYGGNLYWEGYQGTGLLDETGKKTRTRPELTKMVRGVQNGTVRCVIVWSCERIWRNVSICHALIDLFAEKGCRLFDRTGEVNITTPEGRQAVLNAAVASQHMREKTSADVARGWRKNREKNKRIISANVLGFRNAVRTPDSRGNVIHLPEEQELVNRIFHLFDAGENGSRPVSILNIARLLRDDGSMLKLEKRRRPGNARQAGKEEVVYVQQIQNVLKDVRYQGQQRHAGIESPCPVFLKSDGEPVVPTALWERVQKKLNDQKRGGLRTRNSYHALSGLMRCGMCGQSMMASTSRSSVNGVEQRIPVWANFHSDVWCWCTHIGPQVRIDWLDTHVEDVLAPLWLAEVEERLADISTSSALDRCANIRRKIEDNKQAKMDLATRIGVLDDEIINMRADALKTEQNGLEQQLHSTEAEVAEFKRKSADLLNLKFLDSDLRTDALRSVLRWVAVVPSNLPRIRSKERGYRFSAQEDAGRVLFLTSWGTLHTAYLSLSKAEGQRRRVCQLRPAVAHEVIGSIRDLPDPESFYKGLCNSYKIRKHNFSAEEIAPGYLLADGTPPVAEFELNVTAPQSKL